MKYALAFAASELVNFRAIEFASLCCLNGLSFDQLIPDPHPRLWQKPYLVVELVNDEVARKLVERSVLIKSVYQIWCEAPSLSELLQQIPDLPQPLISPYLFDEDATYKLVISSANRKLNHEIKLDLIEQILNSHSGINASVCLQNPHHQLHLLLDYEPRNWGRGPQQDQTFNLRHVYYGRFVGQSKRRDLLNSYRLSDRTYLGNTSMDVRLSGLMANVGLCARGSLVWDPFIGTGSIVLLASAWGALGAGSDIDYALLHGMGMSPKSGQGKRMDGECLRANYQQYGLQSRYLDVVVADAASLHRLLRGAESYCGIFDVVLTDPPYGFRERSRRIAGQVLERAPSLVTPDRLLEITGLPMNSIVSTSKGDTSTLVEVPHDLPHFPHKEVYPLSETYQDLLELSARILVPGGRLVFWVPVNRTEFDGLNSLPTHPQLRLLAGCEQIMNARNSRFLIVMKKLFQNETAVQQSQIDPNCLYYADPLPS